MLFTKILNFWAAKALRKERDFWRNIALNGQDNTECRNEEDPFRFEVKLLELRSFVMDNLTASGFCWMVHYSSIDPLHDVYGIEVLGITNDADAESIHGVVTTLFPGWKFSKICLINYGPAPGFRVTVHRDQTSVPDDLYTNGPEC